MLNNKKEMTNKMMTMIFIWCMRVCLLVKRFKTQLARLNQNERIMRIISLVDRYYR